MRNPARKYVVLSAQAVCLGLLGLIAAQLYSLTTKSAPLADLALAPAAAAGSAAPAAEAPPFPEKYKGIETSGIFGMAPGPVFPLALLGLAGRYAILQSPDGRRDLVPEGGELAGIKLLRLGTNRVLVEHQGKTLELTLFSGLGGSPLLPQAPASPQPKPETKEPPEPPTK